MGLFDEATSTAARPLPVLLLLDTSGSMRVDDKIHALNSGVEDMVRALRREDNGVGSIHLGVITFGGEEAVQALEFQPIATAEYQAVEAAGRTPLGAAFELAREILEDRQLIPSRAYRPTLALLSDGIPTDGWEGPLRTLLDSERASKAVRMAVGVGADADREMLERFDPDVRHVDEASGIKDYLQWVTQSVIQRSSGADPDGGGGTIPAPSLPRWKDVRY